METITLNQLINWALETDATQGDIENELAYHELDINLFDFLNLLDQLKAECKR